MEIRYAIIDALKNKTKPCSIEFNNNGDYILGAEVFEP